MTDVILTRFALTGQQISSMPEDEAVFMIQMSHLGNSISVLQKLIAYTIRYPDNDTELKAQITMQSLLSRILAGMLYEGWEAFRKSFYGTKLSQKYHPKLPKDARKALVDIKSYFNKRNMIKEVRNRFSYHYNRDDVKRQLHELPPDGKYEFFVGNGQGNNLFYASEDIIGIAQVQACADQQNAEELGTAFEKFYDEIVRLSLKFILLTQHCVDVVLIEEIGIDNLPTATTVRVTDVPHVDEVTIPYFVRTTDLLANDIGESTRRERPATRC